MIHTIVFFSQSLESLNRVFKQRNHHAEESHLTSALKICAKLLRGARPSTILANDFAPDNDNAVLYSNPADFYNILRTAVQDLQAKGFSTFKSGSCFADLASVRTNHSEQYDPAYFYREHAIVVPVLITNDIDGAACSRDEGKQDACDSQCEEVRGRRRHMRIREKRVRPILPFSNTENDLLFCRGDEPWSATRPGIIYIVPTRSAIVAEFKRVHLSRYKKQKLKKLKIKKPRKPYTKKDPVKFELQCAANKRGKFKKFTVYPPLNLDSCQARLHEFALCYPLRVHLSTMLQVLSVHEHLNKFPFQFSTSSLFSLKRKEAHNKAEDKIFLLQLIYFVSINVAFYFKTTNLCFHSSTFGFVLL